MFWLFFFRFPAYFDDFFLRYLLIAHHNPRAPNTTANQQPSKVRLIGEAVRPDVDLSTDVFEFGPCNVGDHLDLPLTLQNKSTFLAATVNAGTIAHFAMVPPAVTLAPLATERVLVRFAPNQMGRFKRKLVLTYCDGIATAALRLTGAGVEATRPSAAVPRPKTSTRLRTAPDTGRPVPTSKLAADPNIVPSLRYRGAHDPGRPVRTASATTRRASPLLLPETDAFDDRYALTDAEKAERLRERDYYVSTVLRKRRNAKHAPKVGCVL